MKYTLDYEKYAELARRVAAEGSVLLRNEDGVLPLQKGQRVSIFGRTQFEHYKSGTGSGGMVNAPYVTNITDSLKEGETGGGTVGSGDCGSRPNRRRRQG